ncbi:MAG: chordopoxvirus fusion protein, partial [bacterium]|nr:chordopoxvirus fusion protein [bacterium]
YKDTGKEVVILGEAKSQLQRADIDDLLEMVTKLKRFSKKERFLLAVTHWTKETVVEYAKEKGVKVIQSFEW